MGVWGEGWRGGCQVQPSPPGLPPDLPLGLQSLVSWGMGVIRWGRWGRGWTPPASVLPPKAHTLCDFLFNFTSPLVFMRVIYKGFAL